MAAPQMLSALLFIIITTRVTCVIGNHVPQSLASDPDAITKASTDYGNLVHEIPSSVISPSSIDEITDLIRRSNSGPKAFTIAARGRAHSVRGQATARGGVVVNMTALSNSGFRIKVARKRGVGFYADVGGEQMWIDVLRETLKRGLAPVIWTDYLYLSVGGTLSNAGIGGQAFRRGPQISNVQELDVITGKGEFVTCSRNSNPEVFFAVLGGLGQFGIITRARIVLEKAPTRVKWVRLIYSDFSTYTRDQEYLISNNAPDYVEGFLITNESTTKEWRSSFSTPSNQSDIDSLLKKNHILYSIELVKYYDSRTANTTDKEFQMLLRELNFINGFIFSTDASFFDFLHRVGNLDNESKGAVQYSHPWLNLFIPKSRISDFNTGVLTTIIPAINEPSALFIFYPLNRKTWDDRMSAVIPDEDVFYTLGLLHSSLPQQAKIYDNFNNQILEFCGKNGINVKQYLPYYRSELDWIRQYGPKWEIIKKRKASFDPKMILSPGQGIFNPI